MDRRIGVLIAYLMYRQKVSFLYQLERTTQKTKKIKKYSSLWLLRREAEGFSHKLLKEIEDEDSGLYRKALRMTPQQFEKLLQKVSPLISKKQTNFRNPIGPAERLQATLMYLATGMTQTHMQLIFRIQQSTLSKIIKETIQAIYIVLKEEYLKFPRTEDEWKQIAGDFYQIWGFPNCIGAIDGKHCKIRPLNKMGSNYWCYKGYHSFILMAIADAHYRFVYVDIGVNGRMGDACLWLNCKLKHDIENGRIPLPKPSPLPMTTIISPYTFISDDAFPLTDYNMKPHSKLSLSDDEIRFNHMLSRNRRVVENAFGILANRYQVLFSPIFRDPVEGVKVVLAAVCLHNFLRTENIKSRTIKESFNDNELNNIVNQSYNDYHLPATSGRNRNSALKIRKTLQEYFKNHKKQFNLE